MGKRKRSATPVFLSVRIDDGLRRRVKIAAVRRGASVQAFVLEAIAAFLGKPEPEKPDDSGVAS